MIKALAGNDQVSGLAGWDSIDGGDGGDTLIGGPGVDVLIGGHSFYFDVDTFVIQNISDTGLKIGERNVIDRFDNPGAAEGDRIDLSNVAGGAPLTWMGGSAFTGINQVRVYTQPSNGATVVAINTAGDSAPEARFEIHDGDGGVDDGAYTVDDFLLG